jgi:integrase
MGKPIASRGCGQSKGENMPKGKRHGLYKRAGVYGFRFKDADGKWREKSTGHADFDLALAVKERFDDDLRERVLPTDKQTWSVAQACALWVQNHAAHLGSDKVRSNERSLLRQLCAVLGGRRLKSITVDDLKAYQMKRRKAVGPRAVNLELRILASVLKQEHLWRPIEEHYKPLKERESEKGRALSLQELQRLETAAASKPAWEVAYHCEVLASNTGARAGELRKLQIRDVDLEAQRLYIRKAKTDAGVRMLELNQAAMAAVTRLYERAQLLGACKPEHFLLPCDLSRHTKDGDPLKGGRGFDVTRHQNGWRTSWRRLCESVGLNGLRFHDLRHTFITLMAERNVPLPVVQAMVGHMSAAVTRHYTHISSNAARNAVELLNRPSFVEVFVEDSAGAEKTAHKLLN